MPKIRRTKSSGCTICCITERQKIPVTFWQNIEDCNEHSCKLITTYTFFTLKTCLDTSNQRTCIKRSLPLLTCAPTCHLSSLGPRYRLSAAASSIGLAANPGSDGQNKRIKQHKQGQERLHQDQVMLSTFRLAPYAAISLSLTAWVVLLALQQRANFYAAAVYLSKSNACMLVRRSLILDGTSLPS